MSKLIVPRRLQKKYLEQETPEQQTEPTESALKKMPQPTGWRILILPYKGKGKTAGRDVNGKPRTTVRMEDGILLPKYRLPTEAEWEYAAQAMIGTQWLEEMQTHQRIYPWDGHAVRNPYGKQMGYMLDYANKSKLTSL